LYYAKTSITVLTQAVSSSDTTGRHGNLNLNATASVRTGGAETRRLHTQAQRLRSHRSIVFKLARVLVGRSSAGWVVPSEPLKLLLRPLDRHWPGNTDAAAGAAAAARNTRLRAVALWHGGCGGGLKPRVSLSHDRDIDQLMKYW
jgi:hypothetical protein